MSLNLLPDDISEGIFLRLPLKSVSRFRCVCKNWYNLFRNPNFIMMVHDKCVEKENLRLLLIRGHQIYSSVSYYDSSNLRCYGRTVEIDYPFESSTGSVYIHGSCNGLLLIQSPTLRISIWNPATTEYKEIPMPPFNYSDDGLDFYASLDPRINVHVHNEIREKIAYGFGYDCKIDQDYKLVRVATHGAYIDCDYNEKIYFGCKVKIYTLGSNSWKHIPSIFPYNIDSYNGVFVNGALHWRATNWIGGYKASSKNFIVSFDFEDERLEDVSPREHFDHELIITVGNLGGSLCAFCERGPELIDVWVMKDYGVRESWTKLFTINTSKSRLGYATNYVKPMRSFKNGEILFSIREPNSLQYSLKTLNQGALILYDPKLEKPRTLNIHGGNWSFSHTYVESLVSLNTGMYLGINKKNMQMSGSRFSFLSLEES